MMTLEKNTIDLACFEVNEHGRLLSANKRFCRMFGFEEAEIPWHYITDLYRYMKDWNEFRNSTENSFIIRMKNRKGRSFKCSVVREVLQNSQGDVVFRNTVQREAEDVAVERDVAACQSVAFLAKCAHCATQIRVGSAAETRMKILCSSCAAKEYPEAYRMREAQS